MDKKVFRCEMAAVCTSGLWRQFSISSAKSSVLGGFLDGFVPDFYRILRDV